MGAKARARARAGVRAYVCGRESAGEREVDIRVSRG
jgi:hypothetical protein